MKWFLFPALALVTLAQPAEPRLLAWMNETAQQQLAARKKTIAALTTPEQMAERQRAVRAKLLELIGGLPDYRGPLKSRTVWRKDLGSYVIEGVAYESLPGYTVTANLYRPRALGRYPAILFSMGHWDQGKAAAQTLAVNLARKGFVVLAYDPVGQGERQQVYDRRVGRSIAGGSVEQHFQAGALAVLAGQNVARYFIWDGMRGIDYLMTREEVDPERIGATGCSGGGTQTTYIAALDDRVKVAAPACYMQSFELLFAGPVGDSEQSFPGFLAAGLDQTDYVELFAPKPWLISSTEQDFFTPAAAKLVYDEARAWYSKLDAADRVKWVVGPGGHGTPLVVREAIYDWMIRWLRDGDTSAKEEPVTLLPDLDLQVAGGWVGGRDLIEILFEQIRATPDRVPALPSDDYRCDSQLLPGKGDTAVVVVETGALPGARAKQLAERGVTVLALSPRGLPVAASVNYSGDWIANERAWLIGKNLPLLRAADIAKAVRELKARPGISRVLVHATGVAGYWALYAQANEPAIDRVWVDRTPHSIRAAFAQGLHRDLHDAVIPGVIPAFEPGPKLLWTDPTDWMRNVVAVKGGYVYRNVIADDDSRRLVEMFLAR